MQPLWELIFKLPFAILMFFAAVRLFGLKELAQATAVEFGFAVMAVSIIWDMSLSPEYKLWQIPIVLAVMWIMIYLIDWITHRSKKAEKVIIGEPRILIQQGEVNHELLQSERMSMAELESKLRLRGVFNISQVEIAYLEVSGEISVNQRGD